MSLNLSLGIGITMTISRVVEQHFLLPLSIRGSVRPHSRSCPPLPPLLPMLLLPESVSDVGKRLG